MRHVTEPHFEVLSFRRAPAHQAESADLRAVFVRADYVVVFDAEDRPEPSQLRMAAAAFASVPSSDACRRGLRTDK